MLIDSSRLAETFQSYTFHLPTFVKLKSRSRPSPMSRQVGESMVEHIRLVETADLRFPIILSSEGRVMDGMHRVVKALLAGRATIDAVRFTADPEPDYIDVDPNQLPYDEVLP
jgi:hypothetical protein